MSDNLKNIKELAGFLDGSVGTVLSGLGCLTTVFFLLLPIAFVVYLVTFVVCDGGASHHICSVIGN